MTRTRSMLLSIGKRTTNPTTKPPPNATTDLNVDGLSSQTISKAMWDLISSREHAAVASAYEHLVQSEGLQSLLSDPSTLAAMMAYGCLDRPQKSRQLSKKITDKKKYANSIVDHLICAYCRSDRLDAAESLFLAWLEIHAEGNTESSPAFRSLLAGLKRNRVMRSSAHNNNSNNNSNSNSSNNNRTNSNNTNSTTTRDDSIKDIENPFETLELDRIDLSRDYPGARTWSAMSRLYAGRKAWTQSMHILSFYEQVIVPKYAPTSTKVRDNRRIIFHHTIRALCDCKQFRQAFDVVNQRKQALGEPTPLSIQTQLLKVLSLPDLHDFNSQKDNDALIQYAGATIREIASLDINNAIDTFPNPREKGALIGFVSVYVTMLCKRGLISEAEQLIESLYSQPSRGRQLLGPTALTAVIHALSELSQGQGQGQAQSLHSHEAKEEDNTPSSLSSPPPHMGEGLVVVSTTC